MTASVVSTAFGRPATLALARAVQEAQADDPLAPVTVVVPSNLAGLTARRLLGSGELADQGGPTGIANVSFATPYQLAARLGAADVARQGTMPLSTAALASAVRRVLADDGGAFTKVRGHAATERALVAAYGDVSHLRPATLDTIAVAGGIAAEVVRVTRGVASVLAGFHDEDALVHAATERVEAADPAVLRSVGSLAVHLVDTLSPALTDLLVALARGVPTTLVVGLTGDEESDRPGLELAMRLADFIPAALTSPAPTRLITAADPDEEVRVVVREVLALAETGTPLNRIAVLYPMREPYARIVHQQLDAAGIPWNGPSVRSLGDSMAGRVLRRLLALVSTRELPRHDVIELIASGPLRLPDGTTVPVDTWDRISRRAGVVGGLGDWRAKLDGWAGRQDARADGDDAPGAHQQAEQGRALAAFVVRLHERMAQVPDGWRARSQWAKVLLSDLLGASNRRSSWPEDEQDAADRVDAALDRLAVLDELEPDADLAAFHRAVQDELDAPAGRMGRFGGGIVVGSLHLAAGLDLDATFVVGLAEGSCPSGSRDDALLPDRVRSLAPGELSDRAERRRVQHRSLLAALAAGAHTRVLVRPAGDPRTGRRRRASRWFVDAAERITDEPVFASTLDEVDHPEVQTVESFTDGLRRSRVVTSAEEHGLRALLVASDSGAEPAAHPAVTGTPALAAGFELRRDRRSPRFTRWDGNLDGVAVPSPAAGDVLSPTRLEAWAACPRRYLLKHVLRIGALERPERIVEISPIERGNLVHAVLERFLGEVVERPLEKRPWPDEPWTDADLARVREIAHDVFAEWEHRGITGQPVLWELEREGVLADLEEFLDRDTALRAELGLVPEAVEMAFGDGQHAAAEIDLDGRRTVRLGGRIDRLDLDREGTPVVHDYKTGKSDYYTSLSNGDPVERGTRLQLPVYAEAAAQHYGTDTGAAHYWFVTGTGGFARPGYLLDAARRERFLDVLTAIVDGIESSSFPAHPGEHDYFFQTNDNCRHCDYDAVCPRDRHEEWVATAEDPALARFLHLAEDPEWKPEEDEDA